MVGVKICMLQMTDVIRRPNIGRLLRLLKSSLRIYVVDVKTSFSSETILMRSSSLFVGLGVERIVGVCTEEPIENIVDLE